MVNKSKYGKSAVSAALTLALLTSACGNFSEDVVVKMNEKKVDNDVKPPIEVKEEVTWVEFDESALMYKVDFDKYLKDKLKLSEKVLRNSDVIELLERIHEELGDDIYTKDKDSNKLYNLDGKSVILGAGYSIGKFIYVEFCGDENVLNYDIDIKEKNGKTISWSRSREQGIFDFSKYYITYSDGDGKEYSRNICLRKNSEEFLSIHLYASDSVFDSPSISFLTGLGRARVRLSKEDYDTLYAIMLSYKDSDNLYAFLSENADLLSKYLDQIKEENAEFYGHLCGLINEYMENAKVLHYD